MTEQSAAELYTIRRICLPKFGMEISQSCVACGAPNAVFGLVIYCFVLKVQGVKGQNSKYLTLL